MKMKISFFGHLLVFFVLFSVLVADLDAAAWAVSRETIRCRCDTRECKQQRIATCSTKGSCYVQDGQPALLKGKTRGCIAGEASQSLLCTSHSLPSLLKESWRWPRLVCCSSDLCNAPGLLDEAYNGTQSLNDLSGSPVPRLNGTQPSLMDTSELSSGSFVEKQRPGSPSPSEAFSSKVELVSSVQPPKNAPRKCPREASVCMGQSEQIHQTKQERQVGPQVAVDKSGASRPAHGRKQAALDDGSPLLHTGLMVLTVLCTVMLCAIVLLVYATARYSALPSKYCSDTGLQYVMV